MPTKEVSDQLKKAIGIELLGAEDEAKIKQLVADLMNGVRADEPIPDPKEMGDEDVKNVLYVNFNPTTLDAEGVKKLQDMNTQLTDNVNYLSLVAGQNVKAQFEKGTLPQDMSIDSQLKRTTYRAKVIDSFMSQCPWMANTQTVINSKKFSVEKAQFHAELLTTFLEGFKVSSTMYDRIEGVLNMISQSIYQSSSSSVKTMLYTLSVVYIWDDIMKAIIPTVRTFYFEASQDVKKYVVGKADYEQVNMELGMSQMDFNFNTELWNDTAGPEIKAKLKKAAIDFINKPIEVSVD